MKEVIITLCAICALTIPSAISAQRQKTHRPHSAMRAPAKPQSVRKECPSTVTVNGVSFEMLKVEGGTFTMGASAEQQADAYDDEFPAHKVTLSSYHIAKHEVTQALWTAVMGNNPSSFKGDSLPVDNVSWHDCQLFISKLNSYTGLTFRMPTEAEWEFACRGGNLSKGYKYAGSNDIDSVAWNGTNSGDSTHPVGNNMPNELGIYDMSGNLWEWCSDWFDSYLPHPQRNPKGPKYGDMRAARGGCWIFETRGCRASARTPFFPDDARNDVGLRLAL